MNKQQRGFTLLVAIVLSSVVLAVGLAILDITYKQVVLASSAKQSQIAFYAADAALECALYWDQTYNVFARDQDERDTSVDLDDVACGGIDVDYPPNMTQRGTPQERTKFSIPCAGGGTQATVTIYKNFNTGKPNRIYAEGYNTCSDTDARRTSRGLKAEY